MEPGKFSIWCSKFGKQRTSRQTLLWIRDDRGQAKRLGSRLIEFQSQNKTVASSMIDLSWLTDAQMARLAPYFSKSDGKPCVYCRRVFSGITFMIRNGLRWRDAPTAYGPHKTLYNR